MARVAGIVCALLALGGVGCGSDRVTRGEGTVDVVATTSVVADIVRNAGGERVRVAELVPRDADPHAWRPRPSQRKLVADADLLVRAGGDVDAWASGLEASRRIELLPRLDPLGSDPHWWHDPVRVERAVKEIRNTLARADVHGAGYYEAASADYLARLRRLEAGMRRCLSGVASSGQLLTTVHPGFAYLTARYGVKIVRPRRATVGRRLWADNLGPPAEYAGTYLGAMAENTATIVGALSDGEAHCRPEP